MKQSRPQSSSDDFCLFFCIYPSSIVVWPPSPLLYSSSTNRFGLLPVPVCLMVLFVDSLSLSLYLAAGFVGSQSTYPIKVARSSTVSIIVPVVLKYSINSATLLLNDNPKCSKVYQTLLFSYFISYFSYFLKPHLKKRKPEIVQQKVKLVEYTRRLKYN